MDVKASVPCIESQVGTGVARRETRKPNPLTNRGLNGYFNDIERLALTFHEKHGFPGGAGRLALIHPHLVSLVTKGLGL